MKLWKASGFCFDNVIEECDYPLATLESGANRLRRWQALSRIRDVPIWNLFGSLPFVAEQASKILLSDQSIDR